ncbi:MAG TPA: hypothetical protein VIC32_02190 [Terriglobales bacterium]|jgi:hypothetical protein
MKLDLIHSAEIEEYLLTRMAFSPNGEEIAVGHKQFRSYAVETGAPKAEFGFADFLARLRYSNDGKFIAAANVGDNHPATRGALAVFHADGRRHFAVAAPAPIESCAFGEGAVYWNAHSAVAGAELEPRRDLPVLALPDLQIRDLARSEYGFTCFGREAVGNVQQVEGADLIFRKFRLLTCDAAGAVRNNIDLGIGAGVHALSTDGKLLAVEMVDFKNNERHVSLIDAETGVEANLLSLEANTLPVLEFGLGSEYFLCMKEDAEGDFNTLRVWRTSDLKLIGESRLDLAYHGLATCLEHSTIACLGGGKLDVYALA